jgi:hypothetical protein
MKLTVTEYAKKYKLARQTVLVKIWRGILKAKKQGNQWVIEDKGEK